MPDRTILLGCFEPPGFGGASTSGYQLFRLLRDTLPACYLNLLPRADLDTYGGWLGCDVLNPERLDGVHTFFLDNPTYHHQPGLGEYVCALGPSLMIGIGYVAGYVLKKARPELPMILLATGCQQVKDAMSDGSVESVEALLRGEAPVRMSNDIERRAIADSTLVVTHSTLIARVLAMYFPDLRSKLFRDVLWFYEWIHASARRSRHVARPFRDRDIDILFVASDWRRVEKNFSFVREIAASFPGRAVHVVGLTPEEIAGVVRHGVIANASAIALMGRAKVLACPSRFDAAPGVLFEGAAMGCNLVASRNCGNYHLCHPSLRVEDFAAEGFAERIALALESALPADTREFERVNSLARLCDIIDRLTGHAPAVAPVPA